MDRKAKGNKGEELAVKYLESRGFEILERNYRLRRGEVDVIGLFENRLLVFVEVKMRSGGDFGEAESFVSDRQKRLILHAAEEYIHGINWQKDIRFDIIAVDSMDKLEHFEDAFY